MTTHKYIKYISKIEIYIESQMKIFHQYSALSTYHIQLKLHKYAPSYITLMTVSIL